MNSPLHSLVSQRVPPASCPMCAAEVLASCTYGTRLLRQIVCALQVTYLEGRKVKRRQQAPRWLDEFTVPGQFVAVRHDGSDLTQRLYALANSPYAARRESANLDASIVEACTR